MSTKGEEKRVPGTVEDVYDDYRGRRTAICKALTSDFEEFYRQCDPARDNLCLYGHPDETWEVNPPVDEIPPDLPEPTLGINFARGMQRKDWLCLVAVHSDAWLLAISSFYGSYFDRHDRKRLFNMISELPTILEVVTGRKSVKDKPSVINVGTKNKPSGKPGPELHRKPSKESHLEEVVVTTTHEEGDEHGDTLCGACGSSYGSNEFWICCDICEKWYHGKCVKITPAMAEHINQYKCPLCHAGKRARQ